MKLMVRPTRRITLTHEACAFFEGCQRELAELHRAEASMSLGGVKANGFLHDGCLAALGAWRSMWEVGQEVASGRLLSVLDAYAAPPKGIHALFAQAKHLPLRVRL